MKNNNDTNMNYLKNLSLVIPCYNEEAVLPEAAKVISQKIHNLINNGTISPKSSIYFVDDGSKDKTWEIIENLHQSDSMIKGIKLSRNRGHQNALLAGLLSAPGDVLISMDADLQDDISIIDDMLEKHHSGKHIVYGVRSSRDLDTFFKKHSAQLYYKLIKSMGVDAVFNHADYRLMSRQTIEELKGFNEVNLFLRGMIPLIGYDSDISEYERSERAAGESKYPLKKMLAFAWQGITSFSNFPLRLISWLGFIVFMFTALMSGWILITKLFTDNALPGWASTVLPMYFLGGIQILAIGVIGEYLGKIYLEVKNRPRFIIEKIIE